MMPLPVIKEPTVLPGQFRRSNTIVRIKPNFSRNANSIAPLNKLNNNTFAKLSQTEKDAGEKQESALNRLIEKKKLRFSNVDDYIVNMKNMITMENDYLRKLKEDLIQERVDDIVWDSSNEDKIYFYYKHKSNSSTSENINIKVGDSIRLTHNFHVNLSLIFTIFSISEDDEKLYGAVIDRSKFKLFEHFLYIKSDYRINFLPILRYQINKVLIGLKSDVSNNSISQYLLKKLLGQPIQDKDTGYVVENLVGGTNVDKLNSSQINAIKNALKNKFYLIQGAPGTGKTTCLVSFARNLVSLNSDAKILACTASEKATDTLVDLMEKSGLKTVRIYNEDNLNLVDVNEDVDLNQLAKTVATNSSKSVTEDCIDIGVKNGSPLASTQSSIAESSESNDTSKNASSVDYDILRTAQVVCCTLSGILLNRKLNRFQFNTVIFDDASQIVESDCISAITKGCHHLVMAGDQRQYVPNVFCQKAIENGFRMSLFERLLQLNRSSTLRVQCRMNPSISAFPFKKFSKVEIIDNYIGLSMRAASLFKKVIYFKWPNITKPVFFFNHDKEEDKLVDLEHNPTNSSEAEIIAGLIVRLIGNGHRSDKIGVITFNEKQVKIITDKIESRFEKSREKIWKPIQIGSVESFQSVDKEIVLISCIRSALPNNTLSIQFDPHKLYVALTRAKHAQIIVGNIDTLSVDPIWRDLKNHYIKEGLLYNGPAQHLTLYKQRVSS